MSENGTPNVDDTFLILLNANPEAIDFRLGTRSRDAVWGCVLDTASAEPETRVFAHGAIFPLQSHSLAVLCSKNDDHITT
jgi:hypothetical protein